MMQRITFSWPLKSTRYVFSHLKNAETTCISVKFNIFTTMLRLLPRDGDFLKLQSLYKSPINNLLALSTAALSMEER